MRRIVSLLPSTTEIVHALGCGEQLVGRSHQCDHPAGVDDVPALTAPKVTATGDGTFDGSPRAIIEQALSVYRVDVDALRAAEPDLVLTRAQCEACDVDLDELEAAVADQLGKDVEVVIVAPDDLDDVLADFRRIAGILGVPDRGVALVGAMTRRLDGVRQRVADRPRRRVVTIEWIEPLLAAGSWLPQLLAAAGGKELFGHSGEMSPRLDWGAVRAADPDAIVVLPCGFELDRTRREAPRLRELEGWDELRAVREGQVFLADGHHWFNRPGPRLAASTQLFAEMLHPDLFPGDHEGDGWVRFA